MPVTVVPTVGSSTANSYGSVVEGDAYWANLPNAGAWTSASEAEKGQALIQATDRIDEEDFTGYPVNPLNGTSEGDTQALKFPRYGCENPDGYAYLGTVIPECVKESTFELARAILAGETTVANTGLEGFKRVKLGPLEVEPEHAEKGGALPEVVLRKLRHVMTSVSGGMVVRLSRS